VDAHRDHDTLLMAMEEWPAGVRLDDDFAKDLQAELERLASDIAAYNSTEHDVVLIRQVLLSLMLRVARWHRARQQAATHSQSTTQEAYRLFRRELEKSFRLHWTVSQYAQRLGFSESTLNRACQAAAGQTAKVLIDRRLALEAARMLAHGLTSVAHVSHALGFSEPTNFVRFFSRMVGTTPTLFRTQRALSQPSPRAT
jgi:AraC-like DNA-binding protein